MSARVGHDFVRMPRLHLTVKDKQALRAFRSSAPKRKPPSRTGWFALGSLITLVSIALCLWWAPV